MCFFLDYFFLVFHGLLVLFNLTGWAWRKTQRIHLAVIGLTLCSWIGLGIFYGWGYCPLTDWHWAVKEKLGHSDLPASYIKYYADRLTGYSWDAGIVDIVTAACGLSAFVLACWANSRSR